MDLDVIGKWAHQGTVNLNSHSLTTMETGQV